MVAGMSLDTILSKIVGWSAVGGLDHQNYKITLDSVVNTSGLCIIVFKYSGLHVIGLQVTTHEGYNAMRRI